LYCCFLQLAPEKIGEYQYFRILMANHRGDEVPFMATFLQYFWRIGGGYKLGLLSRESPP
jgi:hypothetical protein